MHRELVVSSSVVCIGYCTSTAVLEVEFISGGVYQYLDVPAATHEALMAAESKGRHVNQRVKGHFRYQRVRR